MLFSKWKPAASLPAYHRSRALWFKDGVGLALCRFQTLEQQLQTDLRKNRASSQAVVLRNGDASGEGGWQKVYGQRGDFHALSAVGSDQLFALGSTYEEDGSETGFLLHSADRGLTWSQLRPPPPATRGLAFYSPVDGYAWTAQGVFHTKDQGHTWEDIGSPSGIAEGGCPPAVSQTGTLVVGEAGRFITRAPDGHRMEVAIPPWFTLERIAAGSDGRIWLLGTAASSSRRQEVVLMSWQPGQVLGQVNRFPDVLPEQLLSFGNSLVIAVAEAERVPPKTHFLLGETTGRRWRDEVPPVASGLEALFLAEDGTIWTAGPAGRIQHRLP